MRPVSMVPTMTDRKVAKLEKCSSTEREQVNASLRMTMREYAAWKWPLLNHKGRMAGLARELGMGFRRVKALYHDELGTAVRADEANKIEALRRRRIEAANRKIEEANRHDFAALQDRIARLEAALFAGDEEFHREQVDALRQSADGRRGRDEPGAIAADLDQ
jgi:AraC-like DNA-binding protein